MTTAVGTSEDDEPFIEVMVTVPGLTDAAISAAADAFYTPPISDTGMLGATLADGIMWIAFDPGDVEAAEASTRAITALFATLHSECAAVE
jgi:hypothetical protein